MAKRRSWGDGGLHWDENRQRWIATAHVGFDARGKRITKKASGKTKTEAKDKLKEILRDLDDGLALTPHGYTGCVEGGQYQGPVRSPRRA
jgi:hypothetical protein